MHVKRAYVFVLYSREIAKYKLSWAYIWRGNFTEACFQKQYFKDSKDRLNLQSSPKILETPLSPVQSWDDIAVFH